MKEEKDTKLSKEEKRRLKKEAKKEKKEKKQKNKKVKETEGGLNEKEKKFKFLKKKRKDKAQNEEKSMTNSLDLLEDSKQRDVRNDSGHTNSKEPYEEKLPTNSKIKFVKDSNNLEKDKKKEKKKPKLSEDVSVNSSLQSVSNLKERNDKTKFKFKPKFLKKRPKNFDLRKSTSVMSFGRDNVGHKTGDMELFPIQENGGGGRKVSLHKSFKSEANIHDLKSARDSTESVNTLKRIKPKKALKKAVGKVFAQNKTQNKMPEDSKRISSRVSSEIDVNKSSCQKTRQTQLQPESGDLLAPPVVKIIVSSRKEPFERKGDLSVSGNHGKLEVEDFEIKPSTELREAAPSKYEVMKTKYQIPGGKTQENQKKKKNQLEEHEPDQIHQSEVVETNLSKTVSVVCASNEKKTKTKSPLGKLFGKKSKTDLKDEDLAMKRVRGRSIIIEEKHRKKEKKEKKQKNKKSK